MSIKVNKKDYKNALIYKLQCSDGHLYIGSTCNSLSKRLMAHKYMAKSQPHRRVYKHITEIGWENTRIVLIEAFPCETHQQLVQREDFFIREQKSDPICLNTIFAFTTPEQRAEQVKQCNINFLATHKDYNKNYYQENKDEITEQKAGYYAENKDKICEKSKIYGKAYYAENKDKIKAKRDAKKPPHICLIV